MNDRPNDKKLPPPEVHGINETAYMHWLHHPVTKMVFGRYLPDFKAAIERDHVARWLDEKPIDPNYESEAKGRCNTIDELATLRFDHILAFYGSPSTEADSADNGDQKAASD